MRQLFELNHEQMAQLLEDMGRELLKKKPCMDRLRCRATVGALVRQDYKELLKRKQLLEGD